MIKIVTDTTSCIAADFAVNHNIPVIPQIINFGTESYLEGVEISSETFMSRLKNSSELPKTAAPPPEYFIRVFKESLIDHQTILCIHPSAEVSGTVRSATIAAAEFPQADIRIIDTRLIASPLAEIVKLAIRWAQEGLSADIIEQRIRHLAGSGRIYFLVSTLDYLAKGGRIGGAQALLGSMLKIKPILTVNDGKVDTLEKTRTYKHALGRLQELVITEYPRDRIGYLTVLHAGVPEQGHKLAENLESQLQLNQIPIYDMPPAIVTHAGPGVLGVTFFLNPDNIK